MLKIYLSFFFILLLIPAVFASSTLSVDSSGKTNYTSIQEAVENAASGDVILVYPGTYDENVKVDKKLVIKAYSNNPNDTIVQPADPKDDIFYVTANNVTITGFHIKGAGTAQYHYEDEDGIYIEGCNGVNISHNHISSNISTESYGVFVSDSKQNHIFDNNINMCMRGIFLRNSSSNKVNNNLLSNNKFDAIYLYTFSNNNEIANNYVYKTYAGTGLEIYYFCNNNTLRNNTLFYNKGGIYVSNADNNYIVDNFVSKHDWNNIYLFESNYNSLINNVVIFSNESGITLENSSDNILSSNDASNNGKYGILVYNKSQNNTLDRNIAAFNGIENISLTDTKNNVIVDSVNTTPFPGFLLTVFILLIVFFSKKGT